MKSKITGTLKYLKHDYKDKSVVLETESGEQVKMRLIRFLNILTKFRDSRISDIDVGEWCWETKAGTRREYIYPKKLKKNDTVDIWFSADSFVQSRWNRKTKITVPRFISADVTLNSFSQCKTTYAGVILSNCSISELEGKEVFMDLGTFLAAKKGERNFKFIVCGGKNAVLFRK
jgi:hypothetical protein